MEGVRRIQPVRVGRSRMEKTTAESPPIVDLGDEGSEEEEEEVDPEEIEITMDSILRENVSLRRQLKQKEDEEQRRLNDRPRPVFGTSLREEYLELKVRNLEETIKILKEQLENGTGPVVAQTSGEDGEENRREIASTPALKRCSVVLYRLPNNEGSQPSISTVSPEEPDLSSLIEPFTPSSSRATLHRYKSTYDINHAVDTDKLRQRLFYCVCGAFFTRRVGLINHIKHYTAAPKFRCDHCPKWFVRLSQSKAHMISAHRRRFPIRTIGCSDCGSIFCSIRALTAHRLSEHPKSKPAPVHCEIDRTFFGRYRCSCEKTFSKRVSLNSHLLKYNVSGATRHSKFSSNLEETPKQHGRQRQPRSPRGKHTLRKLERCLCGSTYPTWKALDAHIQQKL